MSTATTTAWSIPGASGLPIRGDTHAPEGGQSGEQSGGQSGGPPAGTLLIGHGFKGYKDYGFLPRLADAAAEAGWAAARFNFSHAGMTQRDGPFTRPGLFALDTWNKQVLDWHALLAAVRGGRLPGAPPEGPVALFGHSRGGLSALLAAARLASAGEELPGAVVTAAAPADACRLSGEDAATLRGGHAIDSPSGRTGQVLRVMPGWLLEQDADPPRHDPVRAARALGEAGVPLLVLHGTADETVDPGDASRLAAAAGTVPVMIEGGNHVFHAPNPMPPPPEAEVPAATANLFQETLGFLATLHGELL